MVITVATRGGPDRLVVRAYSLSATPVAGTFGYSLILRISDEAALRWLNGEGTRRAYERVAIDQAHSSAVSGQPLTADM